MKTVIGIGIGLNWDYTRGIFRGIKHYVQDSAPPWQLVMYDVNTSPRELARTRIAGVIGTFGGPTLVRRLNRLHIPVVSVSARRKNVPAPRVLSDNNVVGQIVAQHFTNRGLSRFAYLGIKGHWYSELRMRGFIQTLQLTNPGVAIPALELDTRQSIRRQTSQLQQWIRTLTPPVGVMTSEDDLSIFLAGNAQRVGFRVPEDLAIVGVNDDEFLCELEPPGFSSVNLGTERIGYAAAQLLHRILAGDPPPLDPLLIEPLRVVTRRSSEVLAIGDPTVAQALQFIHAHVGEAIGVPDVVNELTVSRRLLELRFQARLGRSPAAEIRRVRIELAKRLLAETPRPVAEVARQAGFRDSAQLSKSFRLAVGLTPTSYRLKFRGH